MRLVCPNCEAKYEVPEDAIPETGRDVQCANCGHAWFQMRSRPGAAETVAPVASPVAPPVPEVAPEPAPEPMPEPEPVVEPAAEVVEETPPAAEDIVPEAVAAVEDAEPVAAERAAVAEVEAAVADAAAMAEEEADVGTEAVVAAAAAPAAYAVDDSVLAILREEAEREVQARRAEGAKPLETQVDLGIDAAIPEARKPVDVPAAALAEAETDDRSENRRTRLPDVEEINSTLRPAEGSRGEDGATDPVPAATEARSSFRSGFLLVLTVAILGSAIYGAADSLAEAVPALAGPLKAYVGFVDSLRLHLDGLMQSATVAINGN